MAFLFYATLYFISIFFGGCILFLTSKLFRITGVTYKKSVSITLALEIFAFIVGLLSQPLDLTFVSKLLFLVCNFLAFAFVYMRYYPVSWKKTLALYVVYSILVAICITLPLRFVFISSNVEGSSMSPHFFTGDVVTIQRIVRNFHRDDVVVAERDGDPDLILKRIIGLPSEKIDILHGQIFINGKPFNDDYASPITSANQSITLSVDQYFLLGDNSSYSSDSRIFGPIRSDQILGKVFVKTTWQRDLYSFLHFYSLHTK